MLIPVRPFCATISRQRLVLRNWEKQQALRLKVSFACLVRVETHRPRTYSASLVTCKSARAWSCTLVERGTGHRGHDRVCIPTDAGICAGGGEQSPSLPRSLICALRGHPTVIR